MQASAVIGANFGDEGKGKMTDYLAEKSRNTIVVRYNGGGQAGHTVVTPDSKRHVFSHFGSGSFTGAATFLSRFFISNPLLWHKEQRELASKFSVFPTIFVDGDSLLSTPFDMLINQEMERNRGGARHGSCGLGINETVRRNLGRTYATFVKDISNIEKLEDTLDHIKRKYVPQRLAELGLEQASNDFQERINSKELFDNYLSICSLFYDMTVVCGIKAACAGRDIIFEGAQGLLLDEDHRFFPYVTRSKTGLGNILSLMQNVDLNMIDVTYATRCYTTRHGAGPFPRENKTTYKDETNVPNEFQGTLRFGLLDIDLLADTIVDDMKSISRYRDMHVNPFLAISCLDQIGQEIEYYASDSRVVSSIPEFIERIRERCGISNLYLSYGPTRLDIKEDFAGCSCIQNSLTVS